MVQVADRAWTLEALHCACLMARQMSATVAIVKMIPVQHPGWLGTEWGNMYFTEQDKRDLDDYQATVEDYGITCNLVPFQYMTLADATGDAAEQLEASVIFAKLPPTLLPFWRKVLVWGLKRRLSRQGRLLIEHPVYDPQILPIVEDALAEINSH